MYNYTKQEIYQPDEQSYEYIKMKKYLHYHLTLSYLINYQLISPQIQSLPHAFLCVFKTDKNGFQHQQNS